MKNSLGLTETFVKPYTGNNTYSFHHYKTSKPDTVIKRINKNESLLNLPQ